MDSVSPKPSATTPPEFLAPEVRKFLDRISEPNHAVAKQYLLHLRSQGRPQSTIRFYARALEHLERTVRKPFETMTRDDITTWLNASQSTLAPLTTRQYLEHARRFFAWIGRGQVFDGVRFEGKARKHPIQVLDQEEVLRLAQAADNQRDRALVMVLYDTGCRQEGLLGLRIKNIQFDEHGAHIHIRETKNNSERYVRTVRSTADLKLWLSMHPRPNPESPLWTSMRPPHEPIGEDGLWHMLRRLARRAGISKRVHAHGFRHTRATHLAKSLTDGQMRVHFGWGRHSSMPAYYAELSGRDTEEALLQEAGVQPAKSRPDPLRTRPCGNCGHANPPTAMVCGICNRPVADALALATYGLQKDGDALVAEVLRRLIERVPRVVAEVLNDSSIRERLTALDKQAQLTHTSA